MKRTIYHTNINDTHYSVAAVTLGDFNPTGFTNTFGHLYNNITLDDYTKQQLEQFVTDGFTEKRVSAAPKVSKTDGNQMVLFSYASYDGELGTPVGLAIIFQDKFYSIGYKEGRRSESELHQIYQNRREIYSENV